MQRLVTLALSVLLLLVCGVLAGCDGDDPPPTGGSQFDVNWPTAPDSPFAAARSLKVEIRNGEAPVVVSTVDRPEDDTPTPLIFSDIHQGSYTFLATAYDGAQAQGVILGQAYGSVQVVGGTPTPITLTTVADPAMQLDIYPSNTLVYVGKTLHLYAGVVNPDGAIVLMPANVLRWSSSNAYVADVHMLTGVVSALDVGDAYITVRDSSNATLTNRVLLNVRYQLPTVDLTASDTEISPGESVTLRWSSRNAGSVDESVNFNTWLLNGSQTVTPTETTKYSITVHGPGGTASDEVTVKVVYPQPSVSISASQTSVSTGQAVTLNWSTSNATIVEEAINFNPTALSGSTVVHPTVTTTYRITVRGPGGTQSSSVTVTVAEQ